MTKTPMIVIKTQISDEAHRRLNVESGELRSEVLGRLHALAHALLNRKYGDIQGDMRVLARYGCASVPVAVNIRVYDPNAAAARYCDVLGVPNIKTEILTNNQGYPSFHIDSDDPLFRRARRVKEWLTEKQVEYDQKRRAISDKLEGRQSRKKLLENFPWATEIVDRLG